MRESHIFDSIFRLVRMGLREYIAVSAECVWMSEKVHLLALGSGEGLLSWLGRRGRVGFLRLLITVLCTLISKIKSKRLKKKLT